MTRLLDTNIISELIKSPWRLAHRYLAHLSRLSTSIINGGELYTWVYRRKATGEYDDLLAFDIFTELRILPYDTQAARQFGHLLANALNRGKAIDSVDLMIAPVTLVHDLTYVIHNVRDFENVPGLRVEDWLQP
jgi:tRNA(fMet)-specific endonuclease VapC